MNSYSTLFFDLDHTLWDYETNSRDALQEIYDENNLAGLGVTDFNMFHKQFKKVNDYLWNLYDHGHITSDVIRNERFKQILEAFNAYEELIAEKLSQQYMDISPMKGKLMPHAIETLDYLSKKYALSLITNGFEDVQRIKLESSGITSYFDHMITSQKAGFKKPAKEIFHYALKTNGVSVEQTVMIGDNLSTDIAGAKNASMDIIFYNPEKIKHTEKVNHEIHSLNELCNLL